MSHSCRSYIWNPLSGNKEKKMDQPFADLSEVERHFDNLPPTATSPSATTYPAVGTPPAIATSPVIPTSPDVNADHACERGTDEAMQFVHSFCHRHGLPNETGQSEVERVCEAIASDAREEFKTMRNANQVTNQSPSTTTLENDFNFSNPSVHQKPRFSNPSSTAHSSTTLDTEVGLKRLQVQKYKKRLRNNRRSAHAAKVYKEVLRRAFSHHLANISKTDALASGTEIQAKTQQFATTATTHVTENIDGTSASMQALRAVQQENMHLRMLLFQHGIMCQPILTPAAQFSHSQQILSLLPVINNPPVDDTGAHQISNKSGAHSLSMYPAAKHDDSESC